MVDDDDDYVEFTVAHPEPNPPADAIRVEEDHTEPIVAPVHTRHDEPAEPMPAPPLEHAQPQGNRREPVRSLFDFLADAPPPKPSVEPIGFAHNGFHVYEEERYQPLDFAGHTHYESADEAGVDSSSRHGLFDDEPRSNGRHSRAEPGDTSRRGRHSRPAD